MRLVQIVAGDCSLIGALPGTHLHRSYPVLVRSMPENGVGVGVVTIDRA